MMTIKEMSELTGVSARALRYYDEIGLFHPTGKSEAGYRLYDAKALEALQQILYFRELDIPLNTIRELMGGLRRRGSGTLSRGTPPMWIRIQVFSLLSCEISFALL